jgi:hypothetical protein
VLIHAFYAWLERSMEPAAMHHGTLFYVQLETNETARLGRAER